MTTQTDTETEIDDPCPRCGGDHDRIDSREPCPGQKAQHTTGPWTLDHSTVVGANGDPVAIITDPDGDTPGDRIEWPWMYSLTPPPTSYVTAESNAHLIAAAPDLRNAVVGLLNGLEHHPSSTHGLGDCGLCIWMDRADAALAKAGA